MSMNQHAQPGSIAEKMQNGQHNAIKGLAQVAGLVVYVGMIAYSAVHNWSLLSAGIAPTMRMWAAVGVIALELTALALPLALHFWLYAPLQRITGFAFYGLDLVMIISNVVLDYAIVGNGGALPTWLQIYKFYVLPATPVACGLGWSLLYLLDPAQRERALTETLRAATREALAGRIAEQAKSADITQAVDSAAGALAREIVGQTLGITPSTPRPLATPTYHPAAKASYNAESEAPAPGPLAGNGHLPRNQGA